jgi:hypothetical protein
MAVAAEQALSFYELANMLDPIAGGLTNRELALKLDQGEFESRLLDCMEGIYDRLGIANVGWPNDLRKVRTY